MTRRAAICAVAQTAFERDKWYQRQQNMGWEVVEPLLKATGLDFAENTGINHIVTVSDDLFDGRTISDGAMTDTVGAHYRCEEKVSQDGAQAVYYAMAMVLSGQADVVMIVAHCKESQPGSRNLVTHMAFDPFFTRPVGLDYLTAAGLQAEAYARKTGLTEARLADLVVRARRNAARNPYIKDLPAVTAAEVLASPYLAAPLRELMTYPVSDGAIGMIVASEERARQLTDKPVWLTGVGSCYDSFFLGDRDLTANFSLKKAAARAYGMAGLTDPAKQADLFEVSDRYAYELPLWAEGLGLCGDGEGDRWLAANGPDAANLNLTGGTLAGVPMLLGGLARVAEAARQLRHEAGAAQVKNAKRAVAQGTTGPAGQHHTVVVLES
ncbi:MAG: thiolase family protein [Myxococcales bacterium]|nr:thiolase family protein [Myxococcales bacterium]